MNAIVGGHSADAGLGPVEELLAVLDQLPVAWCLLDGESRVAQLNRELCETTGKPAEQCVGQAIADCLPGFYRVIEAALPQVQRGGGAEQLEVGSAAFGGGDKPRTFAVSLRPFVSRDGGAKRVLVSLHDITEQRRAEAAMLESTDHYSRAVALSPHIPFTDDPEGMVLDFGSRWMSLTGMMAEETRGTGWAKAVHPDDLAPILRDWTRGVTTGEPVDVEYRFCLADGSARWFRAYVAPWRDADGRIVRWYGGLEDIHERKMAEAALRESEAFSRSILDNSPDCMKVMDLEGRLLFMSTPGQLALELDGFEVVRGRQWLSLWPEDEGHVVAAAVAGAAAGRTMRFTGLCCTAKNTPKWWDNTVSPIAGPDGLPVRLLAMSRDVTEAKRVRDEVDRMHAEVQASAARLSAVLESTTDAVILVDQDLRITYANRHAGALRAVRRPALGVRLIDCFAETEWEGLHDPCRQAMAHQAPQAFEAHLVTSDSWLDGHAYPTGESGLSLFFRDITEQRKAEREREHAQERVAYMARHDALTGLPNRAMFRERIEQAIAQTDREIPAAVLFLDLDHFKAVNDTLGHPVGDGLLCMVADRLGSCVRQVDTIARFGGDEFAVIQVGPERVEDVAVLAQRISDVLSTPYEVDGHWVIVGVSIGIAMVPTDGSNPDSLLKNADIALYRAKAEGRGIFRFFEPAMDEHLQQRRNLELDLHRALDAGEFVLFYQPLVSVASRRICGFEALMRWNHPTRGLLYPDAFIAATEEMGLIVPLGRWALGEACREAETWPDELKVAVNLSAAQFNNDLVRTVTEALVSSGLPAQRLNLEITESLLLQNTEHVLATLNELHEIGVSISMDDFGTGYSSLSYLRRFPFDKIKIDQSFIRDLAHNEDAASIVRAITRLGNALGMATTAEGVETLDQLVRLQAEGCTEVQGFYFSKATPAADIPGLLRQFRADQELVN